MSCSLISLHEICKGPPLKPVKVPLDGIPSLQGINHTTQFGGVVRLTEDALSPTVHIVDKGVKQHQSQY